METLRLSDGTLVELEDGEPNAGRLSKYMGSLLNVRAAKFYVVVEVRNAWNGTTSRRYTGPTAMKPLLSSAMQHAEDGRKQGSKFVIYETPGVLLMTTSGLVTLADFHSDDPFSRWKGLGSPNLKIGAPMYPVSVGFASSTMWADPRPSEDSLIQFSVDLDSWFDAEAWNKFSFVDQATTFRERTSTSIGPNYYLEWADRDARYSPSGVLAIERSFQAAHSERDVELAYEHFTATALRHLESGSS